MASARFICFDPEGQAVQIEVEIAFVPSDWRYKYVYTKSGQTAVIECDFPSVCSPHTLGTPDELGRIDIHMWEIIFINVGDNAEPYRVRITWTQGGETLATWHCEREVEAGGVVGVSESAVVAFRSGKATQHCTDEWGCDD